LIGYSCAIRLLFNDVNNFDFAAAAAAVVAGRLSSFKRHGILRRYRRSRKYIQCILHAVFVDCGPSFISLQSARSMLYSTTAILSGAIFAPVASVGLLLFVVKWTHSPCRIIIVSLFRHK